MSTFGPNQCLYIISRISANISEIIKPCQCLISIRLDNRSPWSFLFWCSIFYIHTGDGKFWLTHNIRLSTVFSNKLVLWLQELVALLTKSNYLNRHLYVISFYYTKMIIYQGIKDIYMFFLGVEANYSISSKSVQWFSVTKRHRFTFAFIMLLWMAHIAAALL